MGDVQVCRIGSFSGSSLPVGRHVSVDSLEERDRSWSLITDGSYRGPVATYAAAFYGQPP